LFAIFIVDLGYCGVDTEKGKIGNGFLLECLVLNNLL